MKKYLLLFFAALLLVACGNEGSSSPDDEMPKEEKFETKKIKLDDEMDFNDFKVKFTKAKAFEKDDKKYIEIEFDWTNLSGEKFSLQALGRMDVLQNGESLDEIDDSWNPKNSKVLGNNAFFSTKNGVSLLVDFTYELLNENDPVEIVFYVIEEDEQKITIDIN